jgi:hypothetical protein
MKKAIALFLMIFLYSCHQNSNEKFSVVKEFQETRNHYKIDTITLENISSEGGEVVVYFNKNTSNSVMDFYVYGEMGKLNYTFFTDKDLKYQFVIKKDYRYGAPITDKNMKMDSTIYYLDYKPEVKLFDSNAKEINESQKKNAVKLELDSFFRNTMKNNVIIRK